MGISRDALAVALRERYRLEREIGRGQSGVVFEARDLRLERTVAIKVLEPELARTVGAERFLREVRIAARLQHPHVLPVLESGEAGGFLYCVLPLVEGTSLRDRLAREGALPIEVALRLAEEVARALEHAHAHGVVHRDLKPENILLSDGQAILCDFGIARALHDPQDGGLTATGTSVGTPRYMSPEQASSASVPDPRSDLYSLGCVLYEMLAGEPPFTGVNAGSVFRQHLSAAVPSLKLRRPEVSAGVAALVERCLAKVPADRPAGAGVLAENIAVLRHVASPQAPTIRADGSPLASARWSAAAAHWPVAAFVLALLVAGAWFVLRPVPSTATIDALAVLPLRNLTGDPGQEYFADGVTEALINDLSRIAALRVISRTSAMVFKGSQQPLPDIARRLGVDAVVEGSIVRCARSASSSSVTSSCVHVVYRARRSRLPSMPVARSRSCSTVELRLSPFDAASRASRRDSSLGTPRSVICFAMTS